MKSFLKEFSKRMGKASLQSYTEATLFPVLAANKIVPETELKAYLAKINESVRLPAEHFDAIYAKLLHNFIEYVQVLPNYYGGALGSMIFESMHRAHMAIKLLFDTADSKPEPLYTFAVFSMALMLDVNHVMATQKVMISDKDGSFLLEWCPFNGSLVDKGTYYKVREYGGHREAFLRAVNPMLAQDLLPEVAASWLYSDTNIYDMWIAVLTGHEEWAGELGHLLKLLKKLLADMGLGNYDHALVDIDLLETPDVDDGERFVAWLKKGLEDGSISVNQDDSMVHMLDEGIFIEAPAIYHAYNKAYSSYRDWVVVQMQFNNLGLPMLSGWDLKNKQHFSARGDTGARLGFLTQHQGVGAEQMKGMLVRDKGILFKNAANIPPVSDKMKNTKVQFTQSGSLPSLAGSAAAVKMLTQPRS